MCNAAHFHCEIVAASTTALFPASGLGIRHFTHEVFLNLRNHTFNLGNIFIELLCAVDGGSKHWLLGLLGFLELLGLGTAAGRRI
jgi:hypothetical protein